MIGLALAAPSVVRAVTGRLKRRLRPRGPAPTWLAVGNSHGYALRTAGAITVLALAVGLAVTQVFNQTTLQAVADDDLAKGSKVDATVTAAEIGGLTDRDVDSISGQPGVDAAVPMIRTTAVWPFEQDGKARAQEYPIMALGPKAPSLVDVDVTDGDLEKLRGDSIALDSSTAWIEGLAVGDRIDLILADGTRVKPTIVATYDRGFGFGKLIASSQLVTDHVPNRHYDAVLVSGKASGLAGWAAERPGRLAHDGGAAAGLAEGTTPPDRWINLVVSLALLGYVLLGVGNSLVAATTRRRTEFALLRLIGATPAQVRTMMNRESLIMTTLAVGAGLLLSVIPQSALGLGLLGLPWPQGPLWLIPGMAALVAAIAYLATA
ncbi:MAG: FtsX-like permease family protein, partial [Stackebrandtia sp.]